ncbi:3'-5' exonuclease [Paracoccus yeei]|uniref:3'-5' exonuclease n=1 Tax=Paracoccus yeei TaxID=147645 RepID=UPI00174DA831|nr:3'-5' exonuclease [Paracoccus yeei]
MSHFGHLMIDLETLGAGQVNVPVVGIGAVFFDPNSGVLGDEFDAALDLDSAMQFGRATGSTIKWWLQQGDAARKVVTRGSEKAQPVYERFWDFCRKYGGNVQVWGNGSSFDISILEYTFPRVINRDAPWKFWNVRDCRTIKELCQGIVELNDKFAGTAHVALDDAKHQARWVSVGWQALRGARSTAAKTSPPAEAKAAGTLLDL